MLEVWLLGKFEVRLDGVAVPLSSRSEQSLLAYLVLNAGTAYRREKLAGLFWPDAQESNAKGYLRLALWHIRRALRDASAHAPDYFTADRLTIAFNGELEYWIDVAVLKKGKSQTIQNLVESTGVYQGELLPGFYDEWVALERESVQAIYERKMSTLLERLLSEGCWQETIEQAERWVSMGGTPEQAYRSLMIAYAGLGQVSAAIAAYQRCVEALKKDLDVAPSTETERLFEKIRSGQQIFPVGALQSIRGFELRSVIGEGSYGTVYRAFQKSVGREVAIKVIRSQYANNPEFIRSFEVEAHIVARLEHPHIVPLYDYWREPNEGYLVMRLLKGGNLETLLESGPLEIGLAVELVDQIAAALATAHRQGVVHGDIKPANILLDESGNAYLSDFGIAKLVDGDGQRTRDGKLCRTDAYVSPEQIQDQPITPQSDIYSFGIVLYQILTGKKPFSDKDQNAWIENCLTRSLPSVRDDRPDLPDEVDEVIWRAAAADPAGRFTDTLTLAAAFRQALVDSSYPSLVGLAPVINVVNPYKGLRAFQEADAADFFGREDLTQRLLARLSETGPYVRFLAVVGPSGSGKSSLVKAGLVPALRHGALPGSEKWFVVKMVPGSHPFEELEIGLLRIATNPSVRLMEPLRRDERGILRAARLGLPFEEGELLLIIDQFEEIFTLAEDKGEARQFLENLYVAVTEPHSPLRVVITLRADFFDRPLLVKGLSTLLQERTEVVVPLSVPELERAIRFPAQRVGVEVEPVLVTAIVVDVMEQPGALPLLQFALTELFERREDQRLTLEAYQAIGGVGGALDRRAEQVFTGLGDAGRSSARQIFLRMVTPGKEASAVSLPTPDSRRRVLRSELETLTIGGSGLSIGLPRQIGDSTSRIAEAIDAFGSARLLSFDYDAATRRPTVEIAHEFLLSQWQRLRRWLEESRGDMRVQRALGYAAAEWSDAGCDPSFLLLGARLSYYEDWAAKTDLALTRDERLFLDASLAERQAQQAADEARKKLESAQKRRVRVVFLPLVLIFFLATLGFLVLAWNARQQANLVTSREQVGLAMNSLEVDPELSVLLSMQALRTVYIREAEDALRTALHTSRVRKVLTGHSGGARSVDFSPDGKSIATASVSGEVTVWQADTGQQLFSQPGIVARYSPDGAQLAIGSLDGTVTLWDTASEDELLAMGDHNREVYDVQFSPDGRLLATISDDGSLKVWDTQTGQGVFSAATKSSELIVPQKVAFSPDGKLLISTKYYGPDWIDMRVWGVDRDWALLNQSSGYSAFAFSPDGRWLAAPGGELGTDIWIWDLAKLSGTDLASLNFSAQTPKLVHSKHDTLILDIAFSQQGSLLATGSQDGTINIWNIDPDGLNLLMTLSGHTREVVEVTFSPDSNQLATASNDGSVRIWDITPAGLPEWFRFFAHDDAIDCIDLTADGAYLATASQDGTAKVWDLATQDELVTVTEHGSPLLAVAISPDGSLLATAGEDNIAKIWRLNLSPGESTAELSLTFNGHYTGRPFASLSGLHSIIFSPDGTKVATGGEDGMAKIWDVNTGRELLSIKVHPSYLWLGVTGLAFSPDGQLLATASDASNEGRYSVAKVWDATSGDDISIFSGHTQAGVITGIAFSPDGKRVATNSFGTSMKIWEARTGQELLEISDIAFTYTRVDFSPDGKLLAAVNADGIVRIWDADSGEQYLWWLASPGEVLYDIDFTPDGKKLIASGDRKVYGFIIDAQELIRIADSRLTRWFTLDECRQYLHMEQCPAR